MREEKGRQTEDIKVKKIGGQLVSVGQVMGSNPTTTIGRGQNKQKLSARVYSKFDLYLNSKCKYRIYNLCGTIFT